MDKKLDLSKPVQTRDGRRVHLYTTDGKLRGYPIVGEVFEVYPDKSEHASIYWWTADGRAEADLTSSGDLVNVPPPPIVGYINVYPPDKFGYAYATGLYATREEADKGAADTRVSCVRVEFPIGRFDD